MGDSSWWWFGSVYLVTNSPSHSTWPFQPPGLHYLYSTRYHSHKHHSPNHQ